MAERARGRRKTNGKDDGSKRRAGVGHNSQGGNVPDEVYRRWLSKIENADNIYEKAKDRAKSLKGELGAIYSAAKEDGCNIDAIKEARAKHKLDHLTVAQDYDDMGRVLRLMKSPLAVQLKLFEEVERSPEANAAMAGELAGRRGDPVDDNPHPPGTELFVTWRANWDKGQQALQETLRD
jgi:hypothetical protein